MRSKIETSYLKLYKEAEALFEKYGSPCNIKTEGGCVTCVKSNTGILPSGKKLGNNLCCYGCKHRSKTGCTVKSLKCKLNFCISGRNTIVGQALNDHPIYKPLRELEDKVRRTLPIFPALRESMEEYITYVKLQKAYVRSHK